MSPRERLRQVQPKRGLWRDAYEVSERISGCLKLLPTWLSAAGKTVTAISPPKRASAQILVSHCHFLCFSRFTPVQLEKTLKNIKLSTSFIILSIVKTGFDWFHLSKTMLAEPVSPAFPEKFENTP
jgi:hypothetical protein